MGFGDFRERMMAGEPLAGTFVKTPAYEVVEVLAQSALDFICLDAEHAPFDRARLDACLAVARALDFPTLVRIDAAVPHAALQALDSGAVGIVVPHVDTPQKAEEVARMSRFGEGGRGYAGSSRWAGFATRDMATLLAKSREETMVVAQIEEPAGVAQAADIAATDGIDGLFLGPADLTVAFGKTTQDSPELAEAYASVGRAATAAGKAYMTFAASAADVPRLRAFGITAFFLASEHSWMRARATEEATAVHRLSASG
ncbi:MAG: aldolase/citrate lyase family protein [Pseudomonadota bacterium]